MKTTIPLSLLLTTTSTLAAPAPVPETSNTGASFPITDLIDSDLTINQYAAQLEAQKSSTPSTSTPALVKRQFNGDTFNQLTDGTPCREITLIYARGTTQDGNVGDAQSEGPTFFNALASVLGGTSRLAVQGVDYAANVLGFLLGGDPNGVTKMKDLVNQAATQCPSTKIVMSGYSQGAQVAQKAARDLSSTVAARVNAVLTFGDPNRDDPDYGRIPLDKTLIICHDGDNICEGGIVISAEHRNYEIDAWNAAAWVSTKV
ncbi:carbohydrate esterase family 5 protein [Periconia macrospinosa]|uniref:Cutinase n=1 Tax=Periconia macrospinosa TaxID=97972 RepID=A0A2V1DU88_9PLEO|nr:carbohydrate esterase family 5 protein [Periconia macrospinosa]